MKRAIYFLLLIFLSVNSISAQCFDPDASIWLNTWSSCEESPNPKTEYGNSHWIQYNFGAVRTLSKSWAWNTNDPDKLNQGFNLVKIDYSSNGQDWEYWGEMDFPKAAGNAIYSGFPGPDLQNIAAQYVLFTAISNHGNPSCAGIAEIKFNLMPGDTIGLPPPNEEDCAAIEEIEVEDITDVEAVFFWEPEIDDDDIYFVFEYREPGGDWIQIITDEPEVFLEGLEPGTLYEFRVAYECEEELIVSEIYSFITLEEGGCAAVQEIWLEEISETTALLAWEGPEGTDFYLVQYSIEGSGMLEETQTGEEELLLEDLEPASEYEFQVGIECNGDIIWSDLFYFSTEGDLTNNSNDLDNLEPTYKLYPNPAKELINFQYSSQENDRLDYKIMSTGGRVLIKNSLAVFPGINTNMIDLSHLPDGVYLLNVNSLKGRKKVSAKVVKIKE